MRIFIDKVVNDVVYFSTKYGNGKGVWKSENKLVEKEYFVELDIDILYKYDDFKAGEIEEYQMKIYDQKILLNLFLLEYDEFGCATFQFGDSILEISTDYDNRFRTYEKSYVTILVERLNIYDENL